MVDDFGERFLGLGQVFMVANQEITARFDFFQFVDRGQVDWTQGD